MIPFDIAVISVVQIDGGAKTHWTNGGKPWPTWRRSRIRLIRADILSNGDSPNEKRRSAIHLSNSRLKSAPINFPIAWNDFTYARNLALCPDDEDDASQCPLHSSFDFR